MGATGKYRGQTADQRRAERRARLIAAGLKLLTRDGIAKTTVTATCATARLTERYFYEHFANRDALLDVLFTQLADDGATHIFAVAAEGPDDPRERTKLVIDTTIELLTTAPGLRSAMRDAVDDEALARYRLAATRSAADATGHYAHLVWGPGDYDSDGLHSAMLFAIAGTFELIGKWFAGELAVSREELVDTAADLFAAVGQKLLAVD